jgi:hypothetical protein
MSVKCVFGVHDFQKGKYEVRLSGDTVSGEFISYGMYEYVYYVETCRKCPKERLNKLPMDYQDINERCKELNLRNNKLAQVLK